MMAPAAIMAAPIVVCTCLYTYESRRRTYTCRVCCSMAGTISAACVLFLLTAETGSTTAEASTAATSNGGRDGRLRESVPVSTPAPAACNVSGTWCWQHSVPPMVFDETAAVAAGSSTNFTISNPTGQVWKLAHGVLRPDRTLSIDYGCGRGPPCQVNGSVDAACSLITVAVGVPGSGTFSRHCPPPPPPPPPQPVPPQPRTFEGDVAWLGEAAIYLQGSSRLFTAEAKGSGVLRAFYSPNMQPGGYGGQFNRDYTYGLLHSGWEGEATAAVWNLTLDNFLWASEQLFMGARNTTGLMPDVVTGAAGAGAAYNRCADQACTFPADSPLPRPRCCGSAATHTQRNCSDGSMDRCGNAVFTAVFSLKTKISSTKTSSGQT